MNVLEKIYANNELYIYGSPGMGKSHLLVLSAKGLAEGNEEVTILVPTHAAKKVLKGMIDEIVLNKKLKDKIYVMTIHAYNGLAPFELEDKDDDREPETEFKKATDGAEPTRFVFIDEVGMVDQSMIMETLFKTRRDIPDAHFVYFGDKNQLEPVNGKLYHSLETMEHIELTKQWRQKLAGTALSKSIDSFKDAIENGSEYVGTLYPDDETLEEVESLLPLVTDGDVSLVACWTNATVIAYNNEVQRVKTGSSDIKIGDEVILYEPLQIFIKDVRGSNAIVNVANNGDIVTVTDITVGDKPWNRGVTLYTLTTENGKVSVDGIRLNDKSIPNFAWNTFLDSNSGSKKGNWKLFKMKCLDFRLPYSRTVHKCQGLSIDKIGVNIDDISRAMFDKNLYNRLMFVALSRATTKVYYVK